MLWAACRPVVDPNLVTEALARAPDLNRAADVALEQRVSPLLLRALDAVGATGPWHDDLRADAARCRARAALVLPALATVGIAPLVAAGLEPVVMKGAALTGRYPHPGLRPMDDVDVLVRRPDVARAVQVLERAGWTQREIPGEQHHEIAFSHPDAPGLPLELHGSFSTRRLRSNRLDVEALWRRRVRFDLGGVDAWRFAPEDEIVAIAGHAAKPFHGFDRLLWAVDIAVVVLAADASGAPIDWDRVSEVARASACGTAVGVALTQAARLGIDPPAAVRVGPATGARRAALASVLSEDWPLLPRDDRTRDRLQYALIDDPRLWVGLLAESGRLRSPVEVVRTAWQAGRRWLQLRRAADQTLEDRGQRVEP